jgi:peroxiredoxin/predicted 2-oxoglutarate/Fe(II)-dependent dioxygenase YbiX
VSAAPETAKTYVALGTGDPAPRFRQWISSEESFSIDKAAGPYVVLCFFMTAGDPLGLHAYEALGQIRQTLDSKKVAIFGISVDQADESSGRVSSTGNTPVVFRDYDASISRLYGAIPQDAATLTGNIAVRRFWIVLDPLLRVLKLVAMDAEGRHIAEVQAYLNALPPPERSSGIEVQAPVLVLPNIFEPELCRRLIALYEKQGGTESGFMREMDGKTVVVSDPSHKRRKDCMIEDAALLATTKQRIARRIVPEIAKAYQFQVTRIERFIVACYTAEDGGLFNAHRDNTTKGTAHRRFAVSLNLNDDYDGGELRFPEFSPKGIKPPAGAAVVFSCSLLHAANEVTRGDRYVFLPFLYDEAASKIREQNNPFLDPAVGQYKA